MCYAINCGCRSKIINLLYVQRHSFLFNLDFDTKMLLRSAVCDVSIKFVGLMAEYHTK